MKPDANVPLRTVIVGCSGIARFHATPINELSDFDLVALCDVEADRAARMAEAYGVEHVYGDYEQMLDRQKPDVVVITTPNNLHAPMTTRAARAGVRGIYCEKPMAVNLGEGRAMVNACRHAGVALAVNHQRRLSAPFRRMRELIVEGAVGRLELLRAYCAGDLLSDCTHLVDLMRHLTGDAAVRWVFGQVHRHPVADQQGGRVQLASGGRRYGHAVETGGCAVFEFTDGVRAEVLTGDLRPPKSAYAEIEAIGTDGRLWRRGDAADPPLMIDRGSGWRAAGLDEPMDGKPNRLVGLACYGRFARMIRGGEPHPLNGDSALLDLEVIMAIYESARTHTKVELPLEQDRFPLQLMIDAGEL